MQAMQAYDFSFEPFVSVCEKDTYSAGATFQTATGQTVQVATSSQVEITECRNPTWDFWIFFAIVVAFFFVVYKVACYVGD